MELDTQARNERRRNFLALIMAGILGIVFVISIFGIYNSTKLVSQTGKFLVNYSTTMTALTCKSSSNAISSLGNTISDVGVSVVDFSKEVSDKTMDVIIYTGELMQEFITLMGDSRKFAVDTFNGARKAISEATRYVVDLVTELGDEMMNLVNKGMERLIDFVDDAYEIIEMIIRKGILPAVYGLAAVPSTVKLSIEYFISNKLPNIIRGMINLGSFLLSNSLDLAKIQLLVISITLTIQGFNKFYKDIINATSIQALVDGALSMLRSVVVPIDELAVFSFCDTIIDITLGVLQLSFVDGIDCSRNFIKLGIWYITNGRFCRDYNLIPDTADCILGGKGDAVIIPASSFTLGPMTIVDAVGGIDFPYIPSELDFLNVRGSIRSLISGLPSITVGWDNITLNTVTGGLKALLESILNALKPIMGVAVGGMKVSLGPVSVTGKIIPPFSVVMTYMMIQLVTKLATIIVNLMKDLISGAVNTLSNKWDYCIGPWRHCIDVCKYLTFGLKSCNECFGVPSVCVSDLVAAYSTIISKAFDLFISAIGSLFSVVSMVVNVLGNLAGPLLPQSLRDEIDAAVDTAVNAIVIPPLPFYVN